MCGRIGNFGLGGANDFKSVIVNQRKGLKKVISGKVVIIKVRLQKKDIIWWVQSSRGCWGNDKKASGSQQP